MAINDRDVMGDTLIGIEHITGLMVKANEYEEMYVQDDPKTDLDKALKKDLVKLYAHILRFLVASNKYLQCNAIGTAYPRFSN